MHIGICCHNYPPHPGGLEIMVQNLATGLAANHRVTVVTAAWQEHAGRRVEDRVELHRLPTFHRSEAWGVPYPIPLGPGTTSAVAALAQADVINVHGGLYLTSVLGASVAKLHHQPLLLTEHVGFVSYQSRALNAVQEIAWRTVGRYVLGAADRLSTYNARVATFLEARSNKPVRFISNGVDHARFRPAAGEDERRSLRASLGLPADQTLALFVGRETSKKNLAAVLAIPRSDFSLIVCGAERSLPADVIDLGVLPYQRMPGLFAAADLMIHASVGEGFPLAVQEAIAAGLPVALLWDQGYSGNLDPQVVAACDRIDDLAAVVLRLVDDPQGRREIAGRQHAWARERWTWPVTVGAYEKLFEDLVQR